MPLVPYFRARFSSISFNTVALAYSAPIFVTPSLSVLRGENCTELGFSLPVGIVVLPLLCFLAFNRISSYSRFTISRYFLSATVILVPYLILNVTSPFLLLLYLLPVLFSYITVELFIREEDTFFLLIRRFAIFLGIFSSLHVLSSLTALGFVQTLSLRGTCNVFNLFSIYQMYIYYPLLLAFAFAILVLSSSSSSFTYAIIGFLALDIIMCSSRESFLISILVLIVKFARARSNIKVALLAGLCLSMLLCFQIFSLSAIISNFESSMLFQKMVSIDVSNPSSLTAGRSDVFSYIFGQVRLTPAFFLTGSAFDDSFLSRETPHNQYLEWFIRGGLPMVLLSAYPIFSALWRSFLLLRRDKRFLSTSLILLSGSVISCIINTPFRAPFSSLFLWFMTFSVHHLYSRRLVAPTQ